MAGRVLILRHIFFTYFSCLTLASLCIVVYNIVEVMVAACGLVWSITQNYRLVLEVSKKENAIPMQKPVNNEVNNRALLLSS